MYKFAVSILESNAKGDIIRSKQTKDVVKDLRNTFPFLKKMLDHKGQAANLGLWENINQDAAQFSKKYPFLMFEFRRLEKDATVQKGDNPPETKTLLTMIHLLNGSISITTLSATESEEVSTARKTNNG